MSEPLTIRCRENGPLVIQGPIKVFDHQGNEYGSHRTCGFQAAEVAKPKEEGA